MRWSLLDNGNRRYFVPGLNRIETPDPSHAVSRFFFRQPGLLHFTVACMLHSRVSERTPLDSVNARNTYPPEISQCLDGIVALGIQPACQDVGIFERLPRTLSGVGQH